MSEPTLIAGDGSANVYLDVGNKDTSSASIRMKIFNIFQKRAVQFVALCGKLACFI
jgi:hypothetical protein